MRNKIDSAQIIAAFCDVLVHRSTTRGPRPQWNIVIHQKENGDVHIVDAHSGYTHVVKNTVTRKKVKTPEVVLTPSAQKVESIADDIKNKIAETETLLTSTRNKYNEASLKGDKTQMAICSRIVENCEKLVAELKAKLTL